MGFHLYELVDLLIIEYAGIAWSRKQKKNLPVWQVYDHITKYLNTPVGGQDIWKSMREQLHGKTSLAQAPREYWNILMLFDMGYTLKEWDDMSVWNRARIIAIRYLKNMVETIDEYYRLMEERNKKLHEKKD